MTRIQLRRGTAAQWTSVNPVLASGEMGIETDTNKFKFGDGTTTWNSLDYVITGEVITDYTELDNLPSINNITLTGNKSSSDLGLQNELTNGTGILISGDTISIDDSVVAMQSDIPDVSNFVTNSNLSVTLQNYQPLLDSGVNIKTINNLSLLGSGNIEIQSGGTYSEGTGIDISNGVISIDTNVVATLNDIPSLTGYATEQWVQNQGYTTNVGTITSVNNTQPDSNGNVSITIPDNTTFMDLSTNQTAYGTKTFNDLRVHQYIRNVAGKIIFYGVGSSFSIGDTTCELTLDGSTTRPYYYNGTTNSEMALLSDIPTVPDIDNTTITKNTDNELQTVAVIDNNSGNALKYWTGTKAQYDAIAIKDSTTLYFLSDIGKIYLGETLISNNSNGKNIGELVYSSLPQTDAGLHLLDGALIQGSGSYSDFVNYIADLYTANPTANYFTDETTWQNTVTQYGVCGKFVYDSTNNTVRLPKVTGIIEGTIDISALGDLVEAGLPLNWLEHKHTRGDMNITGGFKIQGNGGSTWGIEDLIDGTGAFVTRLAGYNDYRANATIPSGQVARSSNQYDYADFAASRSWTGSTSTPNYTSLSHDASTVQPQTIKCFVYIVIANLTKTDIQVDIDDIATDLNGKADVSLSNVNNQAKILMSGMGMPSDKYINLTLGASDSTYTAPANGWVKCTIDVNANGWLSINRHWAQAANVPGYVTIEEPVRKNQNFVVAYSGYKSTIDFKFFYAQGSESEAN